jgi:hypothetical protein
MTLVSAYERLIGARGTEIRDIAQPALAQEPESKTEAAAGQPAGQIPPQRMAARAPPLPERRPHRVRRRLAHR